MPVAVPLTPAYTAFYAKNTQKTPISTHTENFAMVVVEIASQSPRVTGDRREGNKETGNYGNRVEKFFGEYLIC